MSENKVRIYDIMACNVYVDYDFASVNKQHKFLVAFYPLHDVFVPDLIESITAYGPKGYTKEIKNQEYNLKNINGYITDQAFGSCWYMINLPTGFMEEGEYKIEVKCQNGDVVSKSRYQKSSPVEKLVSAYLKHKDIIYNSYTPGTVNGMPKGAPLENVKVKWSTLKDAAGVDAYYIYRISKGSKSTEFNIQSLTWWDNVFVQRLGDSHYGLNKGGVTIPRLQPNTSYAYFVETTDSNAMGETNICIFQQHQIFSTPKVAQKAVSTASTR
jgi:hypothetical protein